MGNIIDPMEMYNSSYFRARHKPSYDGAIAHITQHATGAERLFIEESDYLYMLYLIKKICRKFKLSLLSFVLMINHLHLLARLHAANLPQAMKELFETYAKHFNRKYNRKGHVFCGAYRSTLCIDETHPLKASLYIHRNPVETGLVSNPADYRWSSCALFLNDINKKTFVDFKFILNILDNDILKAREQYRRLLESKGDNGGKGQQALDLLIDKNLEEVIERLKDKNRLREPGDIKARKFLIEQLKARGFNMIQIAQRLNISRRSIYNALS